MNIQSLSTQGISSANPLQPERHLLQSSQTSEMPFVSLLQDLIQNVDAQQQIVAADVDKLARGEAENLHAIAANVAQADLSFRFLLEMRDKLISSYQEVMRMQV